MSVSPFPECSFGEYITKHHKPAASSRPLAPQRGGGGGGNEAEEMEEEEEEGEGYSYDYDAYRDYSSGSSTAEDGEREGEGDSDDVNFEFYPNDIRFASVADIPKHLLGDVLAAYRCVTLTTTEGK